MGVDPGTPAGEAQWQAFAAEVRGRYARFFDGTGPITGARAPGRIDIAGGVVDYSGGTVLEATLAEAALTAVQARSDGALKLRSVGAAQEGLREEVTVPLAALIAGETPVSFEQAAAVLREPADARWAGYVAGCLYALAASGGMKAERATGLNLLLRSTVPIGAGVSSSAALEVASMAALCAHFDLRLDGLEMARLCQIVENRVVGAPCGIMDQVTAALGLENHLLILKCQPHKVLGHQPIPPGWRLVGIDSHVKHSVGGRNYTRARVAAFMGLKILQTESRDEWGGYLCNVSPDIWKPWRERIPEIMTGAEFIARYGAISDAAAKVDPQETYRVRACVDHHIMENDRVREFLALMQLAGNEPDEQLLTEAGQLMLAAHAGYNERLNLGSEETDLLVNLAMERGPERGLFGAKITGGGSGGTVVVLCAGPQADAAIEEVRAGYARRMGILPRLMRGSSPGAVAFGARRIE
jgi:galactokinase